MNGWILFIYLFILCFGLCWVFISMWGLSPVVASGGHSSSWCAGFSLSRPLLSRSTGSRRAGSVVVAHGPSRSAACGILPDQGSNPCPLHWQADSQPLCHQGSPQYIFNHWLFCLLKSLNKDIILNVLSSIFTDNKSIFCYLFIFYFLILFYFGLPWVFVPARRLSLGAASRVYSWLRCESFLLQWLLLLWSAGSRHLSFSSCRMWTQ